MTSQLGQQEKVGIACLYYDYRIQESQTLVNILGDILKQLLVKVSDSNSQFMEEVEKKLDAIQKEKRGVQEHDLLPMLKQALSILHMGFVCMDAIDELEPRIRKRLLSTLHTLQAECRSTRLFLTGRSHIQQEVKDSLGIHEGDSISISADDGDIRAYLIHEIEQDRDPCAMNEKLKEEILDVIIAKSEGMYVLDPVLMLILTN